MSEPVFIVDAFAERAFAGNAAAVVLLRRPREAHWLLQVAREMGQTETAFVMPENQGVRELRWFTPQREIDLCGHATLAAAHVLTTQGQHKAGEEMKFSTRAGILSAWSRGEDIEIDLPARMGIACEPPQEFRDAFGVHIVRCEQGERDYLVEIESDKAVRELWFDLDMLAEDQSVIVTAASSARAFDYVCRYFDPIDGEDPVTGSAHAALAPYWATRLAKRELVGFQASSRGGVVRAEVRDRRVRLFGRALLVVKGTLEVP